MKIEEVIRLVGRARESDNDNKSLKGKFGG